MPDEVEARVFAALDRLAPGGSLGIALSGGGDSTALMHLAAGWGRARLSVATVDHRLRPAARYEAEAAGRAARGLGLPHRILTWTAPPQGNIAAAARQARYRLLGQWAREEGLEAVLLGHTQDDLAEGLLMRLGRGAGLDGLSAMSERRAAEGTLFLRPLLGEARQDLRSWLAARGIGWTDDPSNDDLGRDRPRARHAIRTAGLDAARLAESARHLAAARAALRACALIAAEGTRVAAGAVHLPGLAAQPAELRRLIRLAAVATVTGEALTPRHEAAARAFAQLAEGRRASLAGTILTPGGRVLREPAAAARAAALRGDGIWDNRWRISGVPPGAEVRALGPAAQRPPGLTATEAASAPALWRGELLLGAPCLAPVPGLTATPLRGLAHFRAILGGD